MSESTKTVELACSLTDQEYRGRRKFVRESLIPKIHDFKQSIPDCNWYLKIPKS